MPLQAVIIPHYNDTHRLYLCLSALMPQLDSGTELIVVDNNSTASLAQVRTAFPALRLVTEPTRGAAAARNRGVAETTSPNLCFLDADCIPAPDWLTMARAAASRADIVGGRVELFDETPPPRSGAQAFEAVFAFDNRAYVEAKGFSVTANLITRREVFASVGPFTPGKSEDLDWCHRARALGFGLIYADDLCVAHPSRPDWPALARKWRRLTQESFQVNGTSPVARARWALRALAMPVSAVAHAPRVLRHSGLTGPEKRGALATLVRLRLTRAGWMLRQAAGLALEG